MAVRDTQGARRSETASTAHPLEQRQLARRGLTVAPPPSHLHPALRRQSRTSPVDNDKKAADASPTQEERARESPDEEGLDGLLPPSPSPHLHPAFRGREGGPEEEFDDGYIDDSYEDNGENEDEDDEDQQGGRGLGLTCSRWRYNQYAHRALPPLPTDRPSWLPDRPLLPTRWRISVRGLSDHPRPVAPATHSGPERSPSPWQEGPLPDSFTVEGGDKSPHRTMNWGQRQEWLKEKDEPEDERLRLMDTGLARARARRDAVLPTNTSIPPDEVEETGESVETRGRSSSIRTVYHESEALPPSAKR